VVLKTLSHIGSLHGYGIVLHIQRVSDELLQRAHFIRCFSAWNRAEVFMVVSRLRSALLHFGLEAIQ
jgi:hypothetical protein